MNYPIDCRTNIVQFQNKYQTPNRDHISQFASTIVGTLMAEGRRLCCINLKFYHLYFIYLNYVMFDPETFYLILSLRVIDYLLIKI